MNRIYTSIYPILKNIYGSLNKNLSSIYLFPPLRVTFELTYKCNMDCNFCYLTNQKEAASGYIPLQDELSYSELVKIINQLPRFTLITFTGGEPFLRKDILDILRFSTKRHKCTIITNGTLLNEEIIQELVMLKLPLIGISIDGIEKVHDEIRKIPGAFKKIIDNIKLIQKYKKIKRTKYPMIDIKTVINKKNVEQLSKLIDLAESFSVENLTYQIIQTSVYTNIGSKITEKEEYLARPPRLENLDIDSLKNELEKIIRLSKKTRVKIRFIPAIPPEEILTHYSNRINIGRYTCYAPWTMVRVSSVGDLYPCYNYEIGNLRQNTLKQLWDSPGYKAFREKLKRYRIFPGCIGCCLLEFKGK